MAVRLMFVRTSRGVYQLAGTPAAVELRLSGWKSSATASIDGEDYVLRMRGVFDRGPDVYRAADGSPVLSLRRRTFRAPEPCPSWWRVKMRLRGYEGHLDVPGMGAVSLRMGFGSKSPVEIDADGQWPHRDLVVVAAAFAMIIRRREDSGSSGAVVASTAAAG